MRDGVRETVRLRFHAQCGYCGTREADTGARLTVDHFQPISHGGSDDENNLVYCCHACNSFKSDYWADDLDSSLLHPLRDNLDEHLVESVHHQLVALTARGRIYITVLHLNRPELVAQRQLRYRQTLTNAILHELLNRFGDLEIEIRKLQQQLEN